MHQWEKKDYTSDTKRDEAEEKKRIAEKLIGRVTMREANGSGHFPSRMRGYEKGEALLSISCARTVHGRVLKRQETPGSPTRSKGSSGRRVHRKGRKERRKKMITFVSRGVHARCLSRSDFRSYSTVAYTRNHQLYLSFSFSPSPRYWFLLFPSS